MTNQNMLGKSRVIVNERLMELAMSISNSNVLPRTSVSELMALFGGLLGRHKNNLIKPLEDDNDHKGATKVNAWIDSMGASSPTRTRHESENRDQTHWTLFHPSALNMFNQIMYNTNGKQIIVFLDYDGTLSPIVADPDKAYMSKKMRVTLKDIARRFPTAIVSGRCLDKLFSFVRLAELYYAGSHGMDIKGPTNRRSTKKGNNDEVLLQPASEFLPMINEVYKILVEKTKCVPGAMVENNKFCLSVPFRNVDEKSWAPLAEQVSLVLNDYPKLKLTQGRKVLEIRPTIKWDKGRALEFLLESLGFANSKNVFPIYIGDDRTDEDAFKVLRNRSQGCGILVSKISKETNASYTLQDPSEVGQFLRHLVDWKRTSSRSHKL
uniref:Trehalose 6-phosphate phosphatase n=1 Tax=Medicago sativa TaxID=3879 RepID=D9ILX3_MEDSA|nr:trehalose-6-phosphate phosphatase [Medicago sativa]